MNSHWSVITGLGEAALLLPCALLFGLWLWRADERAAARRWAEVFVLACTMTALSKLAFLAWGLRPQGLHFTGLSGHSMLAALVLPAALHRLAAAQRPAVGAVGVAAGVLLAMLVGYSRIALQAHSPSEVAGGLALGFAGCAAFLLRTRHALPRPAPRMALAGIAALVIAMSTLRIEMPMQHWLERIAVYLSGRERPWLREGGSRLPPPSAAVRTQGEADPQPLSAAAPRIADRLL